MEEPGHLDHVLLDDPTNADLRAKVTQAWQEFARSLAAVLPTLPSGAWLELTLDPTATGTGDAVYAVSVLAEDGGQLRAYAVGNATLPEGYRMGRDAVAALIALGWSPPGVVAGSEDRFGFAAAQANPPSIAAMLARTMRDVYGAPHPAFLMYLAHGADQAPIQISPLGSARPEALPGGGVDGSGLACGAGNDLAGGVADGLAGAADGEPADGPGGGAGELPLVEQVVTVVAGLLKTPADQLQVDADGDIGIRAGSAMVFVRVRDHPPLVDVFSPVLTGVRPTEQLYAKLSELTSLMPIGRLYCTEDTVWASVPVFGRRFQAVHLMLAIQVMTGLADELDDRLHGEFGGRRFFGEGDRAAARSDGERTGMYL
ncbi:MAG TPA: hypothetical protein VFM54_02630 [Micromonosporaceae bacterium]|nr:hypothetical protein [Micromonosporaceae bacterium]